MSWFAPLDNITARGELVANVGGLAGLADARREHEGQFFTPPAVVTVLWRLLGSALHQVPVWHGSRRCRVIDTSAGSGRLLWPCDPDTHEVWAIECDPVCAGPLAEAHTAAGFLGEVTHGRLDEHRIDGFDVALLNPPFSLHWDTPNTEAFPVNAHGRYGPRSSAISHWYALEQAVRGAAVVAAVVPASVPAALLAAAPADGLADLRRSLRAVVHLPRTAFRSAGAEVDTAIIVCADPQWVATSTPSILHLDDLDPKRVSPIAWARQPRSADDRATVLAHLADAGAPAITRPVTGDWRVHVGHSGRRIILGFACGAAEAIVRNAVLRAPLQRPEPPAPALPAGVRYVGQGRLDLEVHLLQDDPAASVQALIQDITACGMQAQVDPGIWGYIASRRRRYAREQIPLRRWAWRPASGDPAAWLLGQRSVRATATARVALGSLVINAGATVTLERVAQLPGQADPWWTCASTPTAGVPAGGPVRIPHAWVTRAFTLPDAPSGGWSLLHPGLRKQAPEAWQPAATRARALGLDRYLTRGYQFDDCVELLARGRGLCAWYMGLGKARLALALAYAGGRHNLIVVEPRLLDEMRAEITAIGLPAADWQEITAPSDTRRLRRINLISYTRLKLPLGGYGNADEAEEAEEAGGAACAARRHPSSAVRSHDTIARRLRHRIHTIVCDEAHILKNQRSAQTRAVRQVAARHAYDLSGTPISNYPRDVLPILRHIGGDGTVVQPYGQHHPLLEESQVRTMNHSRRGVEAFADMFCTVEWVSNEWLDDMNGGAKREIPRIADVPAFRRLVEPYIVRRVAGEPEVTAHMRIPVPTIRTITVPWDDDHFSYYLEVAEHFAHWYADHLKKLGTAKPNLAVLLAKIGAVVQANNAPQAATKSPFRYLGHRTAKQRITVERACELSAQGHKTIIFCHAPGMVELLVADCRAAGIEAVPMHGGIPITRRIRDLNHRFRNGPAPVLIATYGVCQQGLNIHQADRVILYDRDWTASSESQAIARVLRPQQTRPVEVECLHHAGSIDEYQAQMVAFKANAFAAGLDYGEDNPEAEFLHYETILARFVRDLNERRARKVA